MPHLCAFRDEDAGNVTPLRAFGRFLDPESGPGNALGELTPL